MLRGELDKNQVRENFRPSERYAIEEAVKKREQRAAKKKSGGKCPQAVKDESQAALGECRLLRVGYSVPRNWVNCLHWSMLRANDRGLLVVTGLINSYRSTGTI